MLLAIAHCSSYFLASALHSIQQSVADLAVLNLVQELIAVLGEQAQGDGSRGEQTQSHRDAEKLAHHRVNAMSSVRLGDFSERFCDVRFVIVVQCNVAE